MSDSPIIVAYDGSARAQAAMQWALDEGERRRLPVCLVHVFDPESRLPDPVRARNVADVCSEAESIVRRLAFEVYDWGRQGIEVTGEVLDGPVARALCERSSAASMIVVGDRGLGGFTGLRLGSVSLEVAAHAACPVVVVRGELHVPSRRPVAVGVDDAPEARLAVQCAFEEAASRCVGLVAVRACNTRVGRAADETDAGPEQPRIVSERLVAEALTCWQGRYASVDVTTRLMPVTAPHALTLVSHEAQLMVIGSRGRGGMTGLPLGAVSQQVLQHALCSVMIVRGRWNLPGV
jgi:nucleotide-binding universal stress UspA family protein